MISDDPNVIKPTLNQLKKTFNSGKTLDLNYRKQQLKNLITGLKELEDKFHKALDLDLHNSFGFSIQTYTIVLDEVKLNLDELDKWAKPTLTDTPALFAPARSYLYPEPCGIALILGAWNYPLNLAIGYLANAISAGNCAILKPSELTPHSSKAMAELVTKYLDQDSYRCIEGGIEVSQAIIREPFDIIMFTGGTEKGKLVAKAAAENLVPCILELGGKSPTVIGKEADMENAALRIARARLMNSGQTCVACDYVYVHRDVKAQFIEAYKQKTIQFYGQDASKSPDYGRIVNTNHTKRLKSYLDEDHGGKVLMGGQVNINDNYVAPTLIDNPRLDSQLMQNEIFGPILPIYEFTDIEETINLINSKSKPLALYYYGSEKSQDFKQLRARTSSGALICNDSFTHVMNNYLPFGGVGASGYGGVHGYYGFKAFSHFKPVMECNTINSFPASALFPPYTETTKKVIRFSSKVARLKQSHLVNFVIFVFLALILLVFLRQWFGGFGNHMGHIMGKIF